ncbi:MAG: DEAD/DEAH box helicase [Bacteroidetes bacterium]|nr:DEAD/DEAH box helicase [Bacteroidota bacterium]
MLFKDLNLNKPLINALDDLGLSEPTVIQEKAFAPIMAGKDILGIAQTGTGKTFAYLLPLLRQWKFDKKKTPEILIIVPTHELVIQVVEEVKKLAKYCNLDVTGAYGGTNMKTQIMAVLAGVDIIVATPGRLLDLILHGSIKPNFIKKLVIDEVDEMLNLGFRTQIKSLIDLLPKKRQNLMFSATITEEVDQFIEANFSQFEIIETAPTGTPLASITQSGYIVPNFNTKINLLVHLLSNDESMTKVLVFSKNKKLADEVHKRLEIFFPNDVAVIHGNKSQNNRSKTVEQFEDGACSILVASDLIARGIDVSSVTHVVNMDVPIVAENYIHRIGRTGRADQKGVAITLVSEFEKDQLKNVEDLMNFKIPILEVPIEVEISDKLIPEEQPTVVMKTIQIRRPKVEAKGASFHEKKEKNKKVNIKVSRADKMKLKYGKKYKKEHRN